LPPNQAVSAPSNRIRTYTGWSVNRKRLTLRDDVGLLIAFPALIRRGIMQAVPMSALVLGGVDSIDECA